MSTIAVRAAKPYEVHIDHGAIKRVSQYIAPLKGPCKVAVITDSMVGPLYLDTVVEDLTKAGYTVKSYTFPFGEAQKNSAELLKIVNFLAEQAFTRQDLVVALGGGVVGDMAGFAAATYLRGVDYVQIPTSFLAMVDSSVGGKTAVNLDSGKNLWGAFKQPIVVICDPDTLNTLPQIERVNGTAEIIKYGMIGNPHLLEHIESRPILEYPEDWEFIITTCVQDKANIVEKDEQEKGCRQLLNFGHTFAHGIENCSQYAVKHGLAVSIGMAIMTRGAVVNGLIDKATARRFITILQANQLPTYTDIEDDDILTVAKHDKKSKGSDITIVVPVAWGQCELKTISHADLGKYIIKEI